MNRWVNIMLTRLPFELFNSISIYLDPHAIISLRMSCRYLRHFDAPMFLQKMFIFHVKKGNYDIVCDLLKDRRIDPRAFRNLALKEAVARSHYSIVNLLLAEKNADAAVLDCIVVMFARANNDTKMLELLSKFTNIDSNEMEQSQKKSGRIKA